MITYLTKHLFELSPVEPLSLWSYVVIAAIFVGAWIFNLCLKSWNVRNGSISFVHSTWEVLVLDRKSLKGIDIYITGLILYAITRALLVHWAFIASVAMLVCDWIMIAALAKFIYELTYGNRKRSSVRKKVRSAIV